MKPTRRNAAGLAAIVTAGITGVAGLLAGTAGSASAGGFPAFVGPLHRTSAFGLPFVWFDTTIGSGFPETLNSSALVIGPTGAGLGANGVLHVADTLDNRIAAIPNAVFRGFSAGRGFTVSRGGHLNGELGLVIAPNGDILTVNGGNGNLVEVTPSGAQIAVRGLDSSGSPPGRGPCSAWRSSPATTPSTPSTTPPTR
jgi:hypothetical protein